MKYLFALLWGLLLLPPGSTAQNDVDADVAKLKLFLESVDRKYVDSVKTTDLVEKAIQSMFEELDPHSVYMDAERYRQASEPLQGEFVGIGIRYQLIDDTLTVVEVFGDSPAQRAGLMMGDQFITIDGDTVAGKAMSDNAITGRIKGELNTSLRIFLFRQRTGEQVLTTLQRGEIPMSSVEIAYMMGDDVGFIKLNRFSANSYSEFKKALTDLQRQGMENLVLDLRGNSGGYLNIAIKIADEFLNDRRLIVYTEGMHQSRKELFATSGGRFIEGKLVVLIDENSASASEILAGAIQDWDRGLIIGRRSYGKGLVQRTVEFEDGSAMRLTVSRYYTPTGRSIQKPYKQGRDAYKQDLVRRRENGELFFRDSIKVNEEYVYYTPANRPVYGGGGIIPDVFIPLDTSGWASYFADLASRGLLEGFALRYVFRNEERLRKEYPTVEQFVRGFEVDDALLASFTAYAARHDAPLVEEEFHVSRPLIRQFVKSYIARFRFGLNAFYRCYGERDPYITTALNEFGNNTFEELGLK